MRLNHDLIISQNELILLLERLQRKGDPNRRPQEWSVKEIAAHLAITEEECFASRIFRVIDEHHPYLAFYDHTGKVFEDRPLRDWLDRWILQRAQIIDVVLKLTETELSRIGNHETEGPLSILDLMQQMHSHDREHLRDARRLGSRSRGAPGA